MQVQKLLNTRRSGLNQIAFFMSKMTLQAGIIMIYIGANNKTSRG